MFLYFCIKHPSSMTMKFVNIYQLRQALFDMLNVDLIAILSQGMSGGPQACLSYKALSYLHNHRERIVPELGLIVLERIVKEFFDEILEKSYFCRFSLSLSQPLILPQLGYRSDRRVIRVFL